MSTELDTITDAPKGGELRRSAVKAGSATVGWIATRVTHNGVKTYDAIPMGITPNRYGCETFSAALAYIRGALS